VNQKNKSSMQSRQSSSRRPTGAPRARAPAQPVITPVIPPAKLTMHMHKPWNMPWNEPNDANDTETRDLWSGVYLFSIAMNVALPLDSLSVDTRLVPPCPPVACGSLRKRP